MLSAETDTHGQVTDGPLRTQANCKLATEGSAQTTRFNSVEEPGLATIA